MTMPRIAWEPASYRTNRHDMQCDVTGYGRFYIKHVGRNKFQLRHNGQPVLPNRLYRNVEAAMDKVNCIIAADH